MGFGTVCIGKRSRGLLGGTFITIFLRIFTALAFGKLAAFHFVPSPRIMSKHRMLVFTAKAYVWSIPWHYPEM